MPCLQKYLRYGKSYRADRLLIEANWDFFLTYFLHWFSFFFQPPNQYWHDSEMSMLHMDALGKLKRSAPHLDFPALHKELFSVDSWEPVTESFDIM